MTAVSPLPTLPPTPAVNNVSTRTGVHFDTHSTAFPKVIATKEAPLDDYLQAAADLGQKKGDESALRNLLTSSGGALHFQNTPLRTADDFSAFMHALAKGGRWSHHVDKGLMVLRRPHAKNVATANEGPPDQPIGSHNEYGLSSHFPSYIAFFCLSEPEEGGETPIASSLELYRRLKAENPSYIEALQRQGVAFAIHHPRDKIEGSLQGNGLFAPNAFGPDSSEVNLETLKEEERRRIVEENVEALAAEGGWTVKKEEEEQEDRNVPTWKRRGFSSLWQPDGSLLVVQRVPGVRHHPAFGEPTYFNNIHNRFLYSNLHKASKPPHASQVQTTAAGTPFYQRPPYLVGEQDDTPFPQEWFDLVNKTTAELQVDVKWKRGDVLLLDNLAVQHARRTWKGDRRLLASLWDEPR